jgi:hypothetical protein
MRVLEKVFSGLGVGGGAGHLDVGAERLGVDASGVSGVSGVSLARLGGLGPAPSLGLGARHV